MAARLVITIDTEPDNQWTMPSPGSPPPGLTFANTRGLGRLIEFLQTLGTPATWLTSYSVARDTASARLLRMAADAGHEVGGHLHAWETPPIVPEDALAHPYIYEYPAEVRRAKLESMTRAVEDAAGRRPVSYRAGRWGIDAVEYENLAALGYTIDTSVVPGHDFGPSKGLARGGPDFRSHLAGAPRPPWRVGAVAEVPASVATLGWLGSLGSGGAGARLAGALGSRQDLASRAARRILRDGGVCRMVWVRPLMHPRDDLARAAVALVRRGAAIVNVMFHSSEAWAGASPRSRAAGDVERFYGDMKAIVGALRSEGDVTACTLRDAVAAVLPMAPERGR